MDVDMTAWGVMLTLGAAVGAAAGAGAWLRWSVVPAVVAFRLGKRRGWQIRDEIGQRTRDEFLRRAAPVAGGVVWDMLEEAGRQIGREAGVNTPRRSQVP